MRKVILNLAVTLDSIIEGPNGEYDWCLNDQDYGLTDFWESTDAIFIGRKSYELIAANGDINMFLAHKMYVFSDTLAEVAHEQIEIVPSTSFAEDVRAIKEQEGKAIWLFGGASLISNFLQNRLIDELLLSVHPILLGEGKPLFQGIKSRIGLQLLDSTPYPSGLVQLHYAISPEFDLNNVAGAD
ncbi:dihydrofolate reductase family protein [Mucilaginibacter sp. RS28]|uniref:Dihydrofolate reductase family protein n=1 Tax=Mucilaginibacter straminoryzae TaxID=2932774 RepID=A0A9X1X0L6_9SPHI|nr:dihydrofolate reductase family protein [Mucilaginibacter straminoryzae]MCJ8208175.1 dihydrofolate reductase family protein [Mucilaginibacter straminoryzae]